MGSKSENLKYFETWEGQKLEVFTKDGEPTIRMVTEYNPHYGDLVVAFQIGEKQSDTGVKCRYTGKPLLLQEQNCLCGEREFENGSITYEFLYKPLGLPFKSKASSTSFYEIMEALEAKGYKRKRNH